MAFEQFKSLVKTYLTIFLLTIPLKYNKIIESKKTDQIVVIKKKLVLNPLINRKNIIH